MDFEGRPSVNINISLNSFRVGLTSSLPSTSQIALVVPSIQHSYGPKDEELDDWEVYVEGYHVAYCFTNICVPATGKVSVLSIKEPNSVLSQIRINKKQNDGSVEKLGCEDEIFYPLYLLRQSRKTNSDDKGNKHQS